MLLSKQQPSTVIKPPEHPLAFAKLDLFLVSAVSAVTKSVFFTSHVIHPMLCCWNMCAASIRREDGTSAFTTFYFSLSPIGSPNDHFTQEK